MSSILTKFKRRRRQELRRKEEREHAITDAKIKEAELKAQAEKRGEQYVPFEPMHQPGTIVYGSDRSYAVGNDGAFIRLHPGQMIPRGRRLYEVQPKGALKLIGVLPPTEPEISDEQPHTETSETSPDTEAAA